MESLDWKTLVCATVLILLFGHASGQTCSLGSECCPEGEVWWNRGNLTFTMPGPDPWDYGIEVTQSDAATPGLMCSEKGILQVRFSGMGGQDGCMKTSTICSRRLLKVQLFVYYEIIKQNFILDISETAFPFGVDPFGNILTDTVLTLIGNSITVRKSSRCGSQMVPITGFHTAWSIVLYISHQFLKVVVDGREEYSSCWNCLWNLNEDANWGDNTLLIGINRFSNASATTTSYGICNAQFQWLCPDCTGWSAADGLDKVWNAQSTII